MTAKEAIKELQVGYLGDTEDLVQAKHIAIKALEKQIPKKLVHVEDAVVRYTDAYRCPNCEGYFLGTGIALYCYHCGQKLDWN